MAQRRHRPGARPTFTPREVLLLRMVAANTPYTVVAARLGCSVSTIERELAVLRRRLGVATTIEAVVAAVRAGVV